MTAMKLSKIEQTLSAAALKHTLLTDWTLSPAAIRQLQHHFILYWDTECFIKQYNKNGDGTLDKEGRKYRIIFHGCTFKECLASTQQLALSFRVPFWKHTSNGFMCPVVLISCKKSKNHNLHINHKV